VIQSVTIKNFKSIVDLNLDLGRLNILIGENGCGKTNILEAITCYSIAAETGDDLSETLLGLRGVRVPEPYLMKSAFNGITKQEPSVLPPSMEAQISVSNNQNESFTVNILKYSKGVWSVSYSLNVSNPETIDFLEILDQQLIKEGKYFKPTKYRLHNEKLFENNTTLSFLNYCPENYFLRRFEEEGQIRPLGIRGEGLFKHLVDIYKENPELLKKIGKNLQLIGWFKDFEIPNDLMFTERRINIKDKYLQELDYFDQRSANEGFLYLLFYFTLFISPHTPNFFAIDNIDNSLNPKLGAELIRQLAVLTKEHKKQVILTTHNPAILDGLDLKDDAQRLFTIYRNADGHTAAKRITEPKAVPGVEPVRLSEAFIRGYLGGLPKNF
jgi:energy-coupling factor transporter ATP-binding protein EcfA2